jgi:hypothetical protein
MWRHVSVCEQACTRSDEEHVSRSGQFALDFQLHINLSWLFDWRELITVNCSGLNTVLDWLVSLEGLVITRGWHRLLPWGEVHEVIWLPRLFDLGSNDYWMSGDDLSDRDLVLHDQVLDGNYWRLDLILVGARFQFECLVQLNWTDLNCELNWIDDKVLGFRLSLMLFKHAVCNPWG